MQLAPVLGLRVQPSLAQAITAVAVAVGPHFIRQALHLALDLVPPLRFFDDSLAMSDTREIYKGSRRKLVLAFDVGTTYSGISYTYVLPSL